MLIISAFIEFVCNATVISVLVILYVGSYCTEDVDECLVNPCFNGGTCNNLYGAGYMCICMNGWSDPNCRTNVDDCALHPCFNNGTCHDRVGSYHCECPYGKTGILFGIVMA